MASEAASAAVVPLVPLVPLVRLVPLAPARARIGLIVPSINRLSEPQFNHYAPQGITIHAARVRVTGRWCRPLDEMAGEIAAAAAMLADCGVDLIVFHCTDTSMRAGLQGERPLLDRITRETGIEALATSQLVIEAHRALGMERVVVLSPYPDNDVVRRYLGQAGVQVAHDVALDLPLDGIADIGPAHWLELARENDRAEADGFFLGCTNTTQIEAVAAIEQALGKPVVNSNQAVLWGCLERLTLRLGRLAPNPHPQLGRLMGRPLAPN